MITCKPKSIVKTLINIVVSFFSLSFLTFMMAHIMPGDPLYAMFGESAEKISSVQRMRIIENMGLNKPLLYQYKDWLTNFFQGNLGISFKYNLPVKDILLKALGNTLFLGIITIVTIMIFSLLLGFLCALNEGSFIDKALVKLGTFFYCVPGFWLALIFVLIFSVKAGLLPSSGVYRMGNEGDLVDRLIHTILPWLVVFVGHLGYYSNFVRDKIIEELKEDYLVTAKAKGMPKHRILFNHLLRNVMASYITLIAISVNHLLSGSLVIESIFSYPGIGKYIFEAAKYHDYTLLMGGIIIIGIIIILCNVVSDMFCKFIDPRIREVEV